MINLHVSSFSVIKSFLEDALGWTLVNNFRGFHGYYPIDGHILLNVGPCMQWTLILSISKSFCVHLQSTDRLRNEYFVDSLRLVPPTKLWFPMQCDKDIRYLSLSKAGQWTASITCSGANNFGKYSLPNSVNFCPFSNKIGKNCRDSMLNTTYKSMVSHALLTRYSVFKPL